MKLPLPKRKARAAEIDRRGVVTVPDEKPVTPPPAPADAPCGFCGFAREGHGTRYSTFGGTHQWRRTEPFATPKLNPIGDPR